MKARLIQTVDGQTLRTDFGPEVDLIAAMEVRGFAFIRENRNPRQRAELQGAPVFKGVLGPMWDGDALRYEDSETYRILSQ